MLAIQKNHVILGHLANESMWMLGHEGGTSMFPKHGPYQGGLQYKVEVKVTGCRLFPGLAPLGFLSVAGQVYWVWAIPWIVVTTVILFHPGL